MKWLSWNAPDQVHFAGHRSCPGFHAPRNVARVSATSAALQALTLSTDGNTVTWSRSGTGSELTQSPQLLVSANNGACTNVGTMQPSGLDWAYAGLISDFGFIAPSGGIYYVRVRGQVRSGNLNGSAGVIEMTQQFFSDALFADSFE